MEQRTIYFPPSYTIKTIKGISYRIDFSKKYESPPIVELTMIEPIVAVNMLAIDNSGFNISFPDSIPEKITFNAYGGTEKWEH